MRPNAFSIETCVVFAGGAGAVARGGLDSTARVNMFQTGAACTKRVLREWGEGVGRRGLGKEEKRCRRRVW